MLAYVYYGMVDCAAFCTVETGRMSRSYSPVVADVHKQQTDWQGVYRKLVDSTPGTRVTEVDLTWAMECVRSRAFSGPYAGGNARDRTALGVIILALGAAAVASGKVLIEDVLNGLITAFSFNILYDFFLSKKLKWYAMLPVIDFMNHKSIVEVSKVMPDRPIPNLLKGSGENIHLTLLSSEQEEICNRRK
eukprot:scaffold38179_cov46-Prasinocladus_malaysianus.AAC.1